MTQCVALICICCCLVLAAGVGPKESGLMGSAHSAPRLVKGAGLAHHYF